MNNYELAVILNPSLSEGDVEKVGREISGLLTSHGAATILNLKVERRAFAYPIRKQREGTY
ncbi:MAG: 30S ribosomal protein S6, partial [bacterium]